MNLIKCSFILTFVGLLSFACGQQPAGNSTNKDAGNNAIVNKNTAAATPAPAATAKDEVAIAADLYTVNCMTCHKDSGKGGPVTVDGKKLEPDDLTSAKMKKRTDEKLYESISDGAEDDGMPAFKEKLKADEIKLLVAHLRTLQSK